MLQSIFVSPPGCRPAMELLVAGKPRRCWRRPGLPGVLLCKRILWELAQVSACRLLSRGCLVSRRVDVMADWRVAAKCKRGNICADTRWPHC